MALNGEEPNIYLEQTIVHELGHQFDLLAGGSKPFSSIAGGDWLSDWFDDRQPRGIAKKGAINYFKNCSDVLLDTTCQDKRYVNFQLNDHSRNMAIFDDKWGKNSTELFAEIFEYRQNLLHDLTTEYFPELRKVYRFFPAMNSRMKHGINSAFYRL